MRIVIWTPPQGFDESCGGIVVLHKLCHQLRGKGIDAYLYGPNSLPTYKDWNTPTTDNVRESIVVYPEIVKGNPLQGKYVVRWLLNNLGVIGGDGVFGKDDLVFYFADKFRSSHHSSQLMIFERWPDIFYYPNWQNMTFEELRKSKRSGGCFLNHKGGNKKRNPFAQFAMELKCGKLKRLGDEVFRQYEYFYSYDSTTFLSVAAALCGCLSIVDPEESIPAEQWRASHPMNRYGIAYGIEDIPHALETQSLVLPHMEYLEKESNRQLDQFIIKLQQHFEPTEKYTPQVTSKKLADITVVIQSCSLDLKCFQEFVLSYQRIRNNLPRPVVCIDLTKCELIPVPYLEMIINNLYDNGIFYHQRTHKEDYESRQDAGWFTLARGLERAKRNGSKAILFLEDDVQFSSQFISTLANLDYHRQGFGFCTFYQPYGGFNKLNKEVIDSGYCFGTQAVLFSVEAAQYLIDNRDKICKEYPPGKDLRWFRALADSKFTFESTDKSYVQHLDRPSRMGNMQHRSEVFVP